MPISNKKTNELYEVVFHDIMKARVKVNMKLKGRISESLLNEIDNFLSDLTLTCPQKAIEIFKPIKPN